MAEGLFLVRRTGSGAKRYINGVRAVLINSDDAGTDAQIIAEAVAGLNRAFPKDADGTDPFPEGYFDAVDNIDDLSSGPLPDDTDIYYFSREEVAKSEA